MWNVDTISLGIYLYNIDFVDICSKFDNVQQYVNLLDSKIRSKLYLDYENSQKRDRKLQLDRLHIYHFFYLKEDQIYWYKSFGLYSFFYNETQKNLTITLRHQLIEQYTAKHIIVGTENAIRQFFNLNVPELPELILKRVDYYNDYKFRDAEELSIIKEIICRAPYSIYSYEKEIKDTEDEYIVKYLSLKKQQDYSNEKIKVKLYQKEVY